MNPILIAVALIAAVGLIGAVLLDIQRTKAANRVKKG